MSPPRADWTPWYRTCQIEACFESYLRGRPGAQMAACRSLTGRYQPIWSPIAAVQRARVAAFPVKCVARRIGHAGLADEIGITSADGGLSCASHHCASVIRSTRDFAAIIRALHGVMPLHPCDRATLAARTWSSGRDRSYGHGAPPFASFPHAQSVLHAPRRGASLRVSEETPTAVEQLLLAGAPTPVGKHADLGVGEPVDSGSSLRRYPHRGLGRSPASKCSSGAHFWTPLDRAAPLCHGGAGNWTRVRE